MQPKRKRERLWQRAKCPLVIFALSVLFLWPVFFSGRVFLGGDALLSFFGQREIIAAGVKGLFVPLWNPVILSGNSFIGNSQTAMFHPATIIQIFSEPERFFGFALFFSVLVSGLGMFAFCRRIGLSRKACLFAAIAFMFSGQIVSHAYAGHFTFYLAYAMLPLAFFGLENLLRKKTLASAFVFGIALAAFLLAGFLQLFYYASIALLAFFAFRAMTEKGILKKRVFALAAFGVVLAAGLSAVQLLPAIELSKDATRSGGLGFGFASSFSMPLQDIPTLLVPNLFGNPVNHTFWGTIYYWEFCAYVGIATLLLFLLGLFYKRKQLALFFAAVAVVSLLVALGSNTPLFGILYSVVPGFGIFRVPARVLVLFSFFVAITSAFGMESFIAMHKNKRAMLAAKALAIVAAVLIIGTIAFFALRPEAISFGQKILLQKYGSFPEEKISYFYSQMPKAFDWILRDLAVLSVSFAVFSAAIFLRLKKPALAGKLAVALCCLVAADLLFFGSSFLVLDEEEKLFEKTPLVELLQKEKEQFRVLDLDRVLPQHLAYRFGIEKADGVESTISKDYALLWGSVSGQAQDFGQLIDINFEINQNSNLLALDLLNVKFVVAAKKLSNNGLEPVMEKDGLFVYRSNAALPRAFAVGAAKKASREEALEMISERGFEPTKAVLISGEFEEIPAGNGSSFQAMEIVGRSPNSITVKASLEKPAFLVLSENWIEGWRAFDNGMETKIFRADFALRAVRLEKGEHTVSFVFAPQSFFNGLLVSIISLGTAIAAFAFGFFRRPRSD